MVESDAFAELDTAEEYSLLESDAPAELDADEEYSLLEFDGSAELVAENSDCETDELGFESDDASFSELETSE